MLKQVIARFIDHWQLVFKSKLKKYIPIFNINFIFVSQVIHSLNYNFIVQSSLQQAPGADIWVKKDKIKKLVLYLKNN